NLATLLTLFDFGDGTTSTEIRSQTNVAPQALFMMNSEFVAGRARSLAQSLIEAETSGEARVNSAWYKILGREPTREEAAASLEYIRRFPGQTEDDSGRTLAWTSLCRTLIASNDFLYVH